MPVTFDGTDGVASLPFRGLDKSFLFKTRVTVPVTAVSTDIIQCVNIPAGMLVKGIGMLMVTAATATTLTCTVGDGAGAASWDASTLDLKSAAGTWTMSTPSDTYPALGGKYYSAADTIDITVTVNTLTVGAVFDLYVEGINID